MATKLIRKSRLDAHSPNPGGMVCQNGNTPCDFALECNLLDGSNEHYCKLFGEVQKEGFSCLRVCDHIFPFEYIGRP